MLKRVFALCAFGLALPAALLQSQDLFVLPGADGANGTVQGFVTNPLTTFGTFTAGVGSFALLPNSDASKFFVVGSATTDSISAVESTSLTATLVANLSTPATQAIVTPDGRLLAVAAGKLHLYNTATNTELVPGGVSQGSGINTFALVASLDSSTIFALGSSGPGTSLVTAISTANYLATATLPLSQTAKAVSVGPNGLLYVSLPNQILEVDPRTLETTFNGIISVSGTAGPLVFTSDGEYGIGANQSTFGNSLLIVSLGTHTAADPGLGLSQIVSMQVTGVNTLIALSTQGLYQITLSPLTANQIAVPGLAVSGALALTATNDVPTSSHSAIQSAFFVSANTLYQYNPATQTIAAQYPVAGNVTPAALSYAVPAVTTATSRPASLLTYGSNQTILPNSISEPIVVQVLDAHNLPLSGYDVQFQTSSGAKLSSTSAITGANGYALTYVTASATPGPFTVTATAATLTATFPMDVSTTAQGGGGSTLTIISGQGQLMFASTSTALGPAYGTQLKVLATDLNGNPIVGLPVTFSVPPTGGTIQVSGKEGADTQVVDTDGSGVAAVDFLTTSVSADISPGYLQSLVTASATGANAVTFYITAVATAADVYTIAPAPGSTLSGSAGSTQPGAVQERVVSPAFGLGIPNVSLSLDSGAVNPNLFPSLSCNGPGGFVLTSAAGIATCNVVFGPRVGSGNFIGVTGYTYKSLFSTPFTVTAGPPGEVQIIQGNNQTGGPGQRLPSALLVHVTDSSGNTVKGASVNWQVLTAGAVTLSNVVSVTDNNGDASALATLGSIAGVAQVQATSGTASATFNLTVNIPSVGIQKVSGDQQTATTNAAFLQPIVVEVVDSSGNGVAGAQVNFQVTTGAATLGASSVITDSTGQASTTVTASAIAGSITVTATSSTFSVSFTLTALPPGPANITVINGASYNPNTGISPGGIATIRGTGILTGITGVVSAANSAGQLPTTFAGVTITFNGTPAPIYYVSSTNGADQVSVQVPFEVQPGSAVDLTIQAGTDPPVPVVVPVKALAPGVFTSTYDGKTYAVAVRPDGSQVSPTNPAQRGENIQLYITGLGQATPLIATGLPGVSNQTIVSRLVVGLNNGGVPLISAVYGPGLIGIYVVTIQVPADTRTGPYQPIGIIGVDSNNNLNFAQATYIPIQ